MTSFDLQPEIRLSQLWDDLLSGANDPDPFDADAQFVANLHRQLDLPSPTPEIENQIWASVMTATVGTIAAANPTPTRPNPVASVWARVMLSLPTVAWVILAGLLGGFIAGVASRLMMRLSGILTIGANRFLRTDADATVGHITLSGTLFLGGLGAAAGVLALCFYVAIRSRLPFQGWKRSAVFGAILLAVFGYVLMDPANPDYQRFGPAWMNVLTFSSLYLIMGFGCAQIYEARPRFFTSQAISTKRRIASFVRTPVLFGIAIFGGYLAIFVVLLGSQSLIIPLLALIGWAIARTGIQRNLSFFSMPIAVRQWGVWVVPGTVGFILTARGITEILLNR